MLKNTKQNRKLECFEESFRTIKVYQIMIRKSNKTEEKMTYKIEIKDNDKEISAEIEDLKELKKLLEEYTSTDEVKVEKVLKIKL